MYKPRIEFHANYGTRVAYVSVAIETVNTAYTRL